MNLPGGRLFNDFFLLYKLGSFDTSVSEFTLSLTRDDSGRYAYYHSFCYLKNTKARLVIYPPNTSIIFQLSEDDEEGEEGEDGVKSTKRKREKLTRAQLNRRTARNIASFKESRKREQKALLKSLDSLPHVIKSIEVEEKRIEDMKAIREVSHNQL